MSQKNRMAGEELDKDTPVAKEAKQSVIEAKDRNFEARERIAASPERAEARLGQIKSEYDLDGYSDKEVIMSFKGGEFGDKDYARLTGKSVNPEPEAETSPAPDPIVSIPTQPPSTGTPAPPPRTSFPPISGPGIGQIVNQDNDVNSNVTGDNNNVNINQDNSVRQSAGLGATDLMDNYVLNLRKAKTTI